jgi:hypothetical protein
MVWLHIHTAAASQRHGHRAAQSMCMDKNKMALQAEWIQYLEISVLGEFAPFVNSLS